MPLITKEQALERLTTQVRKFGTDELLEVYNDIYRRDPYPEDEAYRDSGPLIARLVDFINGGREVEEIVDLWGLVFTRHRDIWWDEEEERIHYIEEPEAVPTE